MWQHWEENPPQNICVKLLSGCLVVLHHAGLLALVLTLNVECGCELIVSLVDGSRSRLQTVSRASLVFHYYLVCTRFDTVATTISLCTLTANPIRLRSEAKQSAIQQFPTCSPLPVFPRWYVNSSELLLLGFHQ